MAQSSNIWISSTPMFTDMETVQYFTWWSIVIIKYSSIELMSTCGDHRGLISSSLPQSSLPSSPFLAFLLFILICLPVLSCPIAIPCHFCNLVTAFCLLEKCFMWPLILQCYKPLVTDKEIRGLQLMFSHVILTVDFLRISVTLRCGSRTYLRAWKCGRWQVKTSWEQVQGLYKIEPVNTQYRWKRGSQNTPLREVDWSQGLSRKRPSTVMQPLTTYSRFSGYVHIHVLTRGPV